MADENVLARARKHLPILDIGPIGGDCHKADEWVDIKSVMEIKDTFTIIAKKFGRYLSGGPAGGQIFEKV